MAKDKISDYSSTANSNTDIAGINIDEGCAPSGINDAIRTLMAQLKNFQTGTGGDSFNGPVGSTTASTGAFTTLSATGVASFAAGSASAPAITRTGDTNTGIFFPAADTIAFAEGGVEAMRLDASGNMGLGVTPSANWSGVSALQVNTAGSLSSTAAYTAVMNGLVATSNSYAVKYSTSTYGLLYLQSNINGQHQWYNAPSGTAGNVATLTQAMTLDASGNLGVGTTSPLSKLVVSNGSSENIEFGSGNVSLNGGFIQYINRTTATTRPDMNYYLSSGGGAHKFYTNELERMRIDSSGNLLVGVTSGSQNIISKVRNADAGEYILQVTRQQTGNISLGVIAVSQEVFNAANSAVKVGRDNSTLRSINAGGTINASGADYAEYMVKAGNFTVAKGDVVGINAEGKLTNVFADAVSFVVKSTEPSYVGGDVWGTPEAIGLPKLTDESTQEEKDAFESALEAARQLVDRIAFSGQVPVNVTGATAGQFIIPVNDSGAIKGQAVSNPTFEQYQQAVGKVIAIEQDGRARIIVKVA